MSSNASASAGVRLAAIATLAVGLGATTAIFSTVNAALLRPLPFPKPEDVYAVYPPATDGRFTLGSVSGVELMRLNTPAVSIVRAAGSGRIDTTLARDDGTAIAVVAYGVTDGFFGVFGLPMVAGRSFTKAEHAVGAPWVAVLSYRLWRDLFGRDPAILGQPIRLTNGPAAPTTVVGIAPRDFDVPHGADLWVPLPITLQSTGHGFDGYFRVTPGYVAQDNADQVAVIDTASNAVTNKIDTRAPAGMLQPGYTGAAPFAVTISPGQNTLFAVHDGANSIAVIPLTGPHANSVAGLIPTAYGPKDITLSADGRWMYIINGKSDQGPNPLNLFFDTDKLTTVTYPGGNEAAAIAAAAANQYQLNNNRSMLVSARVPDDDDLEELTRQVALNNFYSVEPNERATSW